MALIERAGLRRVVVTGMGAVTPVGLDVASTWDAIVHGRSGVALVERFDTSDLDVKIGGEVKDFDPTTYIDRKETRRMDRFLHIGIVAAQEAMRDSELKIGPDNAEQVGVLVGSGIGGIQTIVDAAIVLHTRGPDRVSPFVVPMMLPDMLAGPSPTVMARCAPAKILRRGAPEGTLPGGAEAPLTRIGLTSFGSLRPLSRRSDEP